jgi:hypothetical protein
MISVVCVFNNENIFNKLLAKSLNRQTVPYQLIAVNNQSHEFHSAAQALNWGSTQAKGEYIMFVHQDIDLNPNFLEESEILLKSFPDFGVAGIAGSVPSIILPRLVSNSKHGIPPQKILARQIMTPIKVQTVDECLMFVKKNAFLSVKFDEIACSHWHLYGVDLCLMLEEKSLNNYVLPLEIYHQSMGLSHQGLKQIFLNRGALPNEYYSTLDKVREKHRHQIDKIYTTCGVWHTSPLWYIFDRILRMSLDIVNYFKTQ